MTSLIVGSGLGVVGSSLTQANGLGTSGNSKIGQGNDLATVNATNGNLVLRGQDEFIAGVGVDDALLRTYNSQGILDGDNNDGWRLSLFRSLRNNGNGTFTRTAADGHQELLLGAGTGVWRSLEGESGGAHDVLRTVSTPRVTGEAYEYEVGGSGVFEMYDSTGKLLGWRDDSGNLTTLTYTGSNVTGVTDTSGQTVTLVYGTSGASKNLLSIQVNAHTPGSSALATQTRVTYTYDASNRLSQVKVDLTPGNTSDNGFFYTSYQYDGTSTRVTKITQSTDAAGAAINSSLAISYVLQGGVYRVLTLTDAQNRTTQFHYDLTNGRTDVTDPMGNVTSYYYDAQGRLVGVESPDLGGGRRTLTSYQYDANGNIAVVTDAQGRAVHYAYDTDGNVKEIRDQTGNTIRRLYDADDRLLAETVFQTPAFGTVEPFNPLTTHYVYDSNERLAFVVTPDGRVTQYLYNALGQRISTLQYSGTLFTTTSQYSASPAYPTATGFDLTSLQNWANSTADKSKVERADTAYDPTGQVQSVTRYTSVNADGTGVSTGASVTRYVYDFEGHLLMQVDPRSTLTGNPYPSSYGAGTSFVTSYAYDGLDRLIVTQDAVGRFTFMSYDDANNKVTTTQTNVLTTVDSYNKSGDLISKVLTGTNSGNLGTTQYYYDSNGWLRMTKDPTGAKTFYFWDALGRQMGVLSPEGELTETIYNNAGQKLRTITYANRVSSSVLSSLVDGSGNPVLSADIYTVRGGTRPDVAPVVDLDASAVGSGYRAAYSTSGTSISIVGSTLTIVDPDDATLASAQVKLNGILNAGLETLSVDATTAANNGITQAYNSSTGILTLTGNVSAANYQAVLSTLQYKNAGSPLKGGDRTIDVTVNDSRLNSNIATAVVTVTGTPTPIVDLNGLGPGTTRTVTLPILLGSPVLLTPNIILYDTTSSTIANATVAIQTPLLTDTMAVTIPAGSGVTSSYNALTGTLSISGTASRDVYTQILRTLTLQAAAQVLDRMVNVSFSNGTTSATSVLTITNSASSDASYPGASAVPATSDGGTAVAPVLSSSSDRTLAWFHNDAGQLIYAVDAMGYVTGYQYDGTGRKVAQTQYATAGTVPTLDPGVVYELTLVTITTSASDRTTQFLYDADGHLQATLDAAGYLTEDVYDAAGQLIKTIAYANATPAAQRGSGLSSGLRPSADLVNDQITYVLYDAQGRISAQVDPAGFLTVYGYDASGNRTAQVRCATAVTYTGQSLSTLQAAASVPGKDQYTFWQYDALNRVTQTLNYQGTLTTYTYNTTTGFLDSMTTASGAADARTASYRYDDLGRVTNTLTGLGSASYALGNLNAWDTDGSANAFGNKVVYDLAGRRIKTIDANNHAIYYYYDKDSRLVYTVDAAGEVTETQYDAFGEVTGAIQYATRLASLSGINGGLVPTATTGDAAFYSAVVNPTSAAAFRSNANNRTTLFSYADKRGLLTQTTDARGFVTASVYDSFGELFQRATDVGSAPYAAARFDQYAYDARGLQTSSAIDVLGANLIQNVSYDAFGRAIRTQDANGNTATTSYDRLGRVITVTDPLNKTTLTSYDAFGRTISLTDRNGNAVTYSYTDSTQTMVMTTQEAVITTVVTNRYGQKISVTTGSASDSSLSTTTYTYDLDGNLKSTIVDAGSGHLNLMTGNTYDNADLLKTVTDANGVQTTYQYDAANRVLKRTVDPTGLNLQTQYVYNAFGQAYQVIDANGITTETVFDNKGESTAVIVDAVDQLGQPGSALKLATLYTYDARGLTLTVKEGVQATGTTNTWSFGAALKTTQYAYDNVGRRTSSIVDPAGLAITTSYAYDDNGNVVRKVDANLNVWRYAYDADNRQIYAIDPLGDVTETRYDNEGRVLKTIQYATPASASLFGSSLSDPPSVMDVQTALAGTPAYSNDFSSSLNGLTVTNNSLSQIQLQSGQLAFSTKANSSTIQPTVTGANYNLVSAPTIFRSEINTGTSTNGAGRNLYVAVGDANGYSYGILFSGTQATVIYYTATTGFVVGPSMTIQDNTTYVVEMSVTSTGISLSMFAKSAGPTSGLTHQLVVPWSTAHYIAQTVAQPGQVAQTSYIDNVGVWQAAAPGALDRSTRNVYDRDGRLSYTLDAVGDVTGYVYDKAGRVIDTIRYAQPIDLTQIPDAPAPSDVSGKVNNSDPLNQHAHVVYDLANRAIYSIDALNDLVQAGYDASGNVIKTRAYANVLPAGTTLNKATIDGLIASLGNLSSDRITRYVYDKANRKVFTLDSLGDVTGYVYDKDGQVTDVVRYTQPINLTLIPDAPAPLDVTGKINANDPLNQHTRTIYGAVGRAVYSVDALNDLTQNIYDALGNVIQTHAYANPLAAGTQINKSTIDGLTAPGTGTQRNNGADRVTRYVYDAAGRQRYSLNTVQVNGDGSYLAYVSGTGYDNVGRVTDTYLYSNKMTFSSDAPSLSTVASVVALNLDNNNDQHTNTICDLAGRIKTVTDAAGHTDSYVYDGVGNKKSYTNKNGAIWNYIYDAAGRMTDEITQPVAVTNLTVTGSNVNAVTSNQAIDTHIVYDGFGNVLENIQNYAPAAPTQSRVTSYRYDALDRQVQTINADTYAIGATTYGSNVGIYNGTDSAIGYIGQATTNQSLTNTTQYDAVGNATVSKDVNGIYTYKAYNAQRQVAYEIDASGYVTGYGYDAFGNQIALTRYANAISTSAHGAAAYTVTQIQALISVSALDRTITTTYNQLNRKVTVVQPIVYSYDSNTQTNATVSPTTTYQYNAFGDAIKQAQLQSVVGGINNWTTTYSYYDLQGNTTATIDPMGYLTQNQYNAFGKVTDQKQWANPLTLGSYGLNGFTAPTATAASVSNAAPATQYTSSFTAGATTSPGLVTAAGSTTISGAAGSNFSQISGALMLQDTYGGTNTLSGVQTTATASYNSSTPSTQQTVFTYNITLGSASGTANGNTGGNNNAQRLIGIGNWNGSTTLSSTFGYYVSIGRDASGNNSISFVQRDGTQVFVHQVAAYFNPGSTALQFVLDANGATAYIYSPGSLPSTGIQYRFDLSNPTGNPPTNIAAQMFVSKASGLGSGEATLAINSLTIVNGTAVSTSNANLQSRQISTVRETQYGYDKLNRQTTVTQVGVVKAAVVSGQVQAVIGNDITTMQYDNMGNVIGVTDPNGATTLNYYNAIGQLVATVGPQHGIYANASQGSINSTTATTTAGSLTAYTYDALGNQLSQTQYASGSTATSAQTSLSVPLPGPVQANSSIDHTSYNFYDSLGRVVKSLDANGNETDTSRDVYGNIVKSEQDYVNVDNTVGHKVQIYAYNSRGLQISESDLLTSGVLATHNTLYDAFGSVTGKYLTGGNQSYLDGSATAPQEVYAYDNDDRLTYAKSSDGIATIYLYDLLGNATAKIVSPSIDLSTYFSSANTTNSPAAVASLASSGLRRIETVYDVDSRAVQQREASFTEQSLDIAPVVNVVGGPTTYSQVLKVVSGVNGTSTVLNYMGGSPIGASVTISLAPIGSSQFSSYSMTLNSTPSNSLLTTPASPIFSLDVTNLPLGVGQYQFRISVTNPSSGNAAVLAITQENVSGTIQIQGPGMLGYVAPASQPFTMATQTIGTVQYFVFKTTSGSTQSLSGMTAVDLVSLGGSADVIRYAVTNVGTDSNGRPIYGMPIPFASVSFSSFRPVLSGQKFFYTTSIITGSTAIPSGLTTQALISALSMGVTTLSSIPSNYNTVQSLKVQLSGSAVYQDVNFLSLPSLPLNALTIDGIDGNPNHIYYSQPLDTLNFNYILTVVDSGGVTHVITGNFQPQPQLFSQDAVPVNKPAPYTFVTPPLVQTLDRWGNVLSSTDADGVTTNYTYDEFNRFTQKKLSQVQAVNDRNFSYSVTPIYQTAYDADGNVIASIDANGNLSTQSYDAAGELIALREGTGALSTIGYDAFGDAVIKRNQNQFSTIYAYDKVGNLTGELDPAKTAADSLNPVWTSYTYDALGRRIKDNRDQIAYVYDAWGNLLSETMPRTDSSHQQKSSFTYDTLGRKIGQTDNNPGQATDIATINAAGNIQSWVYDYYGRLQTNTGMDGIVTTYTYDNAGQETVEATSGNLYRSANFTQISLVPVTTTYSYYENGLTRSIYREFYDTLFAINAPFDLTSYAYDAAGKLIQQKVITNQGFGRDPGTGAMTWGVPAQDTWYTYDAGGRLSTADDRMANLNYGYDAQGNRKLITVSYIDDNFMTTGVSVGFNTSVQIAAGQIYQYDYDADNRVVAEREAQLTRTGTNSTILSQQKGTYLILDAAGNRTNEMDFGIGTSSTITSTNAALTGDLLIMNVGSPAPSGQANAQTQLINNSYDADNRLVSSANVTGWASTTGGSTSRTYNNLDQVTHYISYNYNGTLINDQANTYNPDGTLAQQTNSSTSNGRPASEIYTYDSAGNLTSLNMGSVGAYTYQYRAGKVGYFQSQINVTNSNGSAVTYEFYDILGRLSRANNTSLVTDFSGKVLKKTDVGGVSPSPTTYTSDYIIYYGNEELGSFETARKVVSTNYSDPNNTIYTFSNSSTANFGFNFNPISDQYPSITPGTYTVQVGDTLQSIAQTVYGDSSLWYLIADSNSIRDTADLSTGQVLTLPNKVVAAKNNDSTFKAYNPQEIIGNLNPPLPTPIPPIAKCSALAVIVIIVAIVATVFTAGALSGPAAAAIATVTGVAEASTAATVGAAVIAGAAGAAVGSAASQLTADALHISHGFSFGQVGRAALMGGLSAGLVEGADIALDSSGIASSLSGISSHAPEFVQGLINDAIGQGVGIALRQQNGFSWGEVAGAALSSAILPTPTNAENRPAAINRPFDWSNVGADFDSNFGRGVIKQSVRVLLDHHGSIHFADIAADAFGNALGNSIVGALKPRSQPAASNSSNTGTIRYSGPSVGAAEYADFQNAQDDFNQTSADLLDAMNFNDSLDSPSINYSAALANASGTTARSNSDVARLNAQQSASGSTLNLEGLVDPLSVIANPLGLPMTGTGQADGMDRQTRLAMQQTAQMQADGFTRPQLDASEAAVRAQYAANPVGSGFVPTSDHSGADFAFGAFAGLEKSLSIDPVVGLFNLGNAAVSAVGGSANGLQQLSNAASAIGNFALHPIDTAGGFATARWDNIQTAWANRDYNSADAGIAFGQNIGELGGAVYGTAAGARLAGSGALAVGGYALDSFGTGPLSGSFVGQIGAIGDLSKMRSVAPGTIGDFFPDLHPDSMLHLTPFEPESFISGIEPNTYFARLGDVAHLTPQQYRIGVVGGAAAGYGPDATLFVVVSPQASADFAMTQRSFAGYREFVNPNSVVPSRFTYIPSGPALPYPSTPIPQPVY